MYDQKAKESIFLYINHCNALMMETRLKKKIKVKPTITNSVAWNP
jgi:hypothetical protein